MAETRKFSLVYDGAEDRIAWDLEDTEGATTRLWLTQKLSRGLVGALIPILEKRTAGAASGGSTLQAWEQAAAMAEFGKTPAVRTDAGSSAGLVRAVHIASGEKGFSLTFEFGADETRTVGLETPALRQTLAVIHRLYTAAGWPMDLWPAWIADPAARAAEATVN
jgi:hypothetical protein